MIKPISIGILLLIFSSLTLTRCTSFSKSEIKNHKGVSISKDSLDNHIEKKMQELKIPGLSIAVINDGRVIYHNTFGYANLEKKHPVTDKTIFEGASISKSVFVFFVMKYVEEGKLDLDKPLFEYLPYQDISHDERYKKITARMVLSHKSGLPNWRENEEDKSLKIKFEPGTGFEYSGEGYQYLAMVLKHIEGGNWNFLEKSFQNKVARPLGMKNTVFIQNKYTRQFKAEPYDKNGKWIDWENNYWYRKDNGIFVAPSSLHSEAIDFSKWMITIMKEEYLSKESYHELFDHQSDLFTSDLGINYYYTLGFVSGDKEYKDVYFHNGSNDGFTSWYLLDVEKDWGYVLFTNSENGEELGEKLFEYFDGIPVWK